MSDPRRQRKLWYAIGGVLITAFLAFGATSFTSNLTPYVSFDEAMRGGKKVQIAGSLEADSTRYVEANQELSFGLVDECREETPRRLRRCQAGQLRGGDPGRGGRQLA